MRTAKRPRTVQTPGSTRCENGQLSGAENTPGLLTDRYEKAPGAWDYMQQRGSRIKELEDQLASSQAERSALQHDLLRMQRQVEVLEQGLSRAHAASAHRAQLAERSEVTELERLLGEELSKALELEAALASCQGQLADAEARASEAVATAKRAAAEHGRALGAAHLEAEAAYRQLAAAAADADDRLRKAQLEAKLERRKREADQEVNRAVQRQLDELRAEAAAAQGARPGGSRQQQGASPSGGHTTAAARCRELSGLVDQLSERVAVLQAEAGVAAQGEAAQRAAAAGAKARADSAEARAAQLEKETERLAMDLAGMHEKLGRGDVKVGASVRVLHFKMNPEAQFHREHVDSALSELRTENQVLTKRLAELAKEVEEARRAGRAGGGGGASAASHADAETSGGHAESGVQAVAVRDAQLAVLHHRLGEMEKTMVRLKEVTKERIFAFREACYCLFGYRVDMTSEATSARDAANAPTTFSLKPHHTDDANMLLVFRCVLLALLPHHTDDANMLLVFRYTKAGGMQLVPNKYSERMGREVDTFIHKFKCIPAFTSNLTMENFQKQTQC
ncbi:hypothetical protein FOA52_014417 [Chlamydomonas sp. UWO 241]|nr:hypothetical protein FOA52_014417 [Chlamydomonas sp. UWO 241]